MLTEAVDTFIYLFTEKKKSQIRAACATVQNEWNVVAIKDAHTLEFAMMHASEIAARATSINMSA